MSSDVLHDLRRDTEPFGVRVGPWIRRAVLAALSVLILLALFNVFGQVTETSTATGPAATLTLNAPATLRGGLLFQARIDVVATRDLAQPRIVFGPDALDGLQVNTIEPSPVSESSRDGRPVLTYDTVKAGEHLRVWMEFQVDPTSVGTQDFSVELDDEHTAVAVVHRTLRVWP